MLKTCFICNRQFAKSREIPENDWGKGASPATNNFFTLLERYLGRNYFGGVGEKGDEEAMRFLLQQVICAGTRFCGECSKIAESFCELNQELKSIELLINWKVGMLKEVLTTALEAPIKLDDFEEGANGKLADIEDVSADEIVDLVMDFKRDLIKKCDQKLKTSFPKLQLVKSNRNAEQGGCLETKSTSLKLSTTQIPTNKQDDHLYDEDLNACSPSPTQSPLSVEYWNDSSVEAHNGIQTAQLSPHTTTPPDSEIEKAAPLPETTTRSYVSVKHLDPVTFAKNRGNSLTRKLKPSILRRKVKSETEKDKNATIHVPPPVSTKCTVKAPLSRSIIDLTTGKLKCSRCPKEFSTDTGFQQHYKVSHLNIRHKCGLCQKDFTMLNGYREHYRITHAGIRFDCKKCGKIFTRKVTLRYHMKKCEKKSDSLQIPPPVLTQSTNIKPPLPKDCDGTINPATGKLKCSQCPKEFPTRRLLRRHCRHEHLNIRYLCGLCQKDFYSTQIYRNHYKAIHAGLRFTCSKCGKVFAHVVSYKSHLSATTCGVGEGSIAKCEICNKTLSTHSNLRYHINTVHGTPSSKEARPRRKRIVKSGAKKDSNDSLQIPPPVSTQCTDKTPLPKSVIDPATGKLKCNICAKKFSSTTGFRHHHRSSHLNIRHKCSVCQMDFSYVKAYRDHYKTVHAGVRYKCKKCGKIFIHKASHRNHLKTCEKSDASTNKLNGPSGNSNHSIHIPPPISTPCTVQPPSIIDPATGKIKCSICSKEFLTREGFRLHYKVSHLNIRHRCGLCQKNFRELKIYREHYETVHGGVRFKCKKCGELFASTSSHRNHLMVTTCGIGDDARAKYGTREKIFLTDSGNKHPGSIADDPNSEEIANANPSKVKEGRGIAYVEGDDSVHIPPPLPSHRLKVAPKGIVNLATGKVKCSFCPKEFTQSASCGAHYRRVHLRIRYKCTLCNRDFSTPQSYKIHYLCVHKGKNVRAGVRTMCQKCGKIFEHYSSYRAHLKATTCGVGEDAIAKCTICGKVFSKHTNLKTHIKVVHHKVREHLCDVCGIGYKLKGDLKRHRQRVHPEVVQAEKMIEQEQVHL